MATISFMQENKLEAVANFIAEMNNKESFHIGYCGRDSTEIKQYIKEEIPYNTSFITAYDGGKLVGVLGFDPDIDSGNAEIWGPFALANHWNTVDEMWEKMIEILPKNISSVSLFPNKRNKHVLEFAQKYQFNKESEEAILVFDRSNSHLLQEASLEELTPKFYDAMEQLHDKTFPGTYYSGRQIIERLDEYKKVFIRKENEELIGYIYVEAEPEFGDASIEFFGVLEDKRGLGIGGQLLKGAIRWLFTFEAIDSITLCVNMKNDNAIRLYQKVGFTLQDELCFFKKRIL
ncbi:GNAT family N-acetyltransferase [Ornithinibacillus bavariensis]|uniref:GNAT family N-acetyltransferase n=1 Tax=Ornithinibacillus bavariensis TaxID=545502 RepID=UPI000EC9EEDC|nr:GNAT family N-acetyltransferase [Ornithinibacillus sp.]